MTVFCQTCGDFKMLALAASAITLNTTALTYTNIGALTSTSPANVDGAAAVVGVAATAARADHKHSLPAAVAPVNVTKAAAAAGTSTNVARDDHKHDVTTAAATANPPGTASAEGTATSLARSDHTHALPAYGSAGSTICQGNDARLSDDRTGSGLRSATTVVSVSAAAAPTNGQILTATAGNAATWQTPSGASILVQNSFTELTADQSTTSASFVDLTSLTKTLTTGANFVIVKFTCSCSNTAVGSVNDFQLLVDGVAKRGTSASVKSSNDTLCVALVYKIAVTAASHTIKLQWRTSSGTLRSRPVTTIVEHGSLLIQEVTN
jgi:hypothetical protein